MPQGEQSRAFTVVRHGYDRTEVNRYFQQLEAGARHAAAERDYLQQQLDAARAEIAALTERVARLGEQPAADDRSATTKAAAEHGWAAAEQASALLVAEVERQHEEIRAAHQEMIKTVRATAEEMTAEAERRRQEMDAEAERDRIRIDREFSVSMKAKREALRKELETQRAAASREAERLVREANEHAERRIREANEQADRRIREANEEADRRLAATTAEVDRLTALRDQLAGQLRNTKQLVEQVTATLAPGDSELNFEDTLLFPPPVPAEPRES